MRSRETRQNMRQHSAVLLSPTQETENLSALVTMLNDYSGRERDWQGKSYGSDDATQVRRIVRAWQEARSDSRGSLLLLPRMRLTREDRAALEQFTKSMQVRFEPNGTLALADFPSDPAAFRFLRLLRSSNATQGRLGGPCRNPQCNEGRPRWFVRKTLRGSVFCSPHCAGNATKANERARKRKRDVAEIKKAIANYEGLPVDHQHRSMDWRTFVTQAIGTSKKFLTQTLATGEIAEPTARGKRHATKES
jgi:hypothetical protein